MLGPPIGDTKDALAIDDESQRLSGGKRCEILGGSDRDARWRSRRGLTDLRRPDVGVATHYPTIACDGRRVEGVGRRDEERRRVRQNPERRAPLAPELWYSSSMKVLGSSVSWQIMWLPAGALALSLLGCKKKEPTFAETLAVERPKMEPKVAAIEKVAKAPLPAASGKISKLAGPPLRIIYLGGDKIEGNATMVFDADLKDNLKWIERVGVRVPGASGVANDCVMMLRNGTMAGIHDKMFDRDPMIYDEQQSVRLLPVCSLIRYLVVVKMLDFKPTKYIDKESFGGGTATAEALVFDLDTGTYHGGVKFSAKSSGSIKGNMDDDLMSNFAKALSTAIEGSLPDAKL